MEDFSQKTRLVGKIRESGKKLKEAKVPKNGTGANLEGFDNETPDDEVEAHFKGGTGITAEPSQDKDDDDDVEAHFKMGTGGGG